MRTVDVVVVSYNSGGRLRDAVLPLVGAPGVSIIVVDNGSVDDSLATVSDLDLLAVPLPENGGFAYGCNAGWRLGDSRYVLFLNPDARLSSDALGRLVEVLEADPGIGAVGPRIEHPDGSLDLSLRRFPRIRSTYAQALFLHRLFPRASWSDEVVRDPDAYERAGSPEWISGACLLVRRDALVHLDGLDEGFFMYSEDIDLCRRLRNDRYEIRYEPTALAVHEGGASAPRPGLLPVLAASRIRYAEKHDRRAWAALQRVGITLGELTHMVVSSGGGAVRVGHAHAFRLAVFGSTTRT